MSNSRDGELGADRPSFCKMIHYHYAETCLVLPRSRCRSRFPPCVFVPAVSAAAASAPRSSAVAWTGRPGRSGRTLITEEVWQCLLGKVRNGRSLHAAARGPGICEKRRLQPHAKEPRTGVANGRPRRPRVCSVRRRIGADARGPSGGSRPVDFGARFPRVLRGGPVSAPAHIANPTVYSHYFDGT